MSLFKNVIIFSIFIFASFKSFGQTEIDTSATYEVIKSDGGKFLGKIISKNEKEIVIVTKNLGSINIPMYVIKEIRKLSKNDFNAKGDAINPPFYTRYFFTTNGFPLHKEDGYLIYNWFGLDYETGFTEHLSGGIMTSWIAVPIIGSIKYATDISPYAHVSVGVLAGFGSYLIPRTVMGLPYAALTFGNKERNITFSGGYGAISIAGTASGKVLGSVSGLLTITKKIGLVFDSFIFSNDNSDNVNLIGVFMPGLRAYTGENKIFQFGLAEIYYNHQFVPFPFPLIQWHQKI